MQQQGKEYYQKVLNDFQVFQRDADTHIREMQTLLAAFSNVIKQGIQMDPRQIDYIRERLPGKYLDLLDHVNSVRVYVQEAGRATGMLKEIEELEAKEKAEAEAKAKEAEAKAKTDTKAPEEKAVKTAKKK